nr:hypothetical protein Iba_chr13bCG5200 [Ipomoea batatas]
MTFALLVSIILLPHQLRGLHFSYRFSLVKLMVFSLILRDRLNADRIIKHPGPPHHIPEIPLILRFKIRNSNQLRRPLLILLPRNYQTRGLIIAVYRHDSSGIIWILHNSHIPLSLALASCEMRELKPELEPALSLEPVGLGFENIGEVWRSAWVNSSSGSSFGSIIGTPFAAAELEGPSWRNGTRDPIFHTLSSFFLFLRYITVQRDVEEELSREILE